MLSRNSQRASLARAARLALGALGSLVCGGCDGHYRGPAGYTGPPIYIEQEPNDLALEPDFIGSLGGYETLIVRGDLEAAFGDVDGFAFVSREPITVEFALDAFDPGADLDLCLYDPLYDEFIDCYTSPFDEKGRFDVLDAGREFHLVVYSDYFDYGSGYDLRLRVDPLCCYGAQDADDGSAGARLLAPSAPRPAAPPERLRRYAGRDGPLAAEAALNQIRPALLGLELRFEGERLTSARPWMLLER